MFYYIKGKLAKLDAAYAVIDASGVGYRLTISRTTHSQMPPHLTTDTPPDVKLYTYMAVREDGIELFGFMSEDELSAFKMLITVSGVGPKAAISVLSTLTPQKLAIAVCTDDKKSISQANGVGAKTAARIVLELKDKLKGEAISEDDGDGGMSVTDNTSHGKSKVSDAQDALVVLGYSRSEAANALRQIDTATLELDDIIRLALKKLLR